MWKNRTFATACYADDGHALKHKSRFAAMHAVVLFLSLAFLFPSLSWGACTVVSQNFSSGFGDPPSSCANNCHSYGPTKGEVASSCGASISNCPSSYQSGGYYYTNAISAGVSIGGQTNWLGDTGYYGGSCSYCSSSACHYMCRYGLRCSTQAEADSVSCVSSGKLWQNGQCQEPPRDTLTICQNTWGGDVSLDGGGGGYIGSYMELWKCPDNYTSYEDCVPQMRVPGTCSQNGYEAGVQPKDSIPRTADCFASFEGDCYMMDRATQQQFLCSCATDNNSGGDCSQAYRDLQSGACRNPYASSSASSSPSSSGSSSPSSSGGTSSPSSSGSGGDRPGESHDVPRVDSAGTWNYNYSGILNAINNNVIAVDNSVNRAASSIGEAVREQSQDLGFIRANTQQVASNTQYTNNLINNSVVPSINGAANSVTMEIKGFKDEWSGLWSDFNEKVFSSSSVVDTSNYPSSHVDWDTIQPDTNLSTMADTLAAHRAALDSLMHSIDSARADTVHNVIALDAIYDFSDSLTIKQKMSNIFFPASASVASGSCPVFNPPIGALPIVGQLSWKIDFGNLFGNFDLCSFVRWLVRLSTAILIIFGTFKAVVKAFASGG